MPQGRCCGVEEDWEALVVRDLGKEAPWCPTWLWPWPEQAALSVAGRRREPGRWDVLSEALHLLQPSL